MSSKECRRIWEGDSQFLTQILFDLPKLILLVNAYFNMYRFYFQQKWVQKTKIIHMIFF